MNITERKLMSQENITTETNSQTIRTYKGINTAFLDFLSSLKTKPIILRK